MAARCGFRGVECQQPYCIPTAEMGDALNRAGVEMVLINTPPSASDPELRGLAILPDRVAEFRQLAETAIQYAAAIGCPRLHVVAGRLAAGLTAGQAEDTFVANLAWAAGLGQEHGVRILIEPLNGIDNPGYFLTTAAQARKIIDRVGHENLYLQYDLYHGAMIGEDVVARVAEHFVVIDHLQMAGVPGRHEPDTGDVDMPAAFAAIADMGYAGWLGAEYRPATTTMAGLGWAAPYGIAAPTPA